MAARHRRRSTVTHPAPPLVPVGLDCHSPTGRAPRHQTSSRFCIVCVRDGLKNTHRCVKSAARVRSESPAEQLSPADPLNCRSHPPSPSHPAWSHSPAWTLPASASEEIQTTVSLPIPQCRGKKGNCSNFSDTRCKTEADVLKGVPKSKRRDGNINEFMQSFD